MASIWPKESFLVVSIKSINQALYIHTYIYIWQWCTGGGVHFGPLTVVPAEHHLNTTACLSIATERVYPFTSRIMHHITKLKSSETGLLNTTMGHCVPVASICCKELRQLWSRSNLVLASVPDNGAGQCIYTISFTGNLSGSTDGAHRLLFGLGGAICHWGSTFLSLSHRTGLIGLSTGEVSQNIHKLTWVKIQNWFASCSLHLCCLLKKHLCRLQQISWRALSHNYTSLCMNLVIQWAKWSASAFEIGI